MHSFNFHLVHIKLNFGIHFRIGFGFGFVLDLDLILVCFGFVALHCGGKVASIDRIELELDFSGMVALDWQR